MRKYKNIYDGSWLILEIIFSKILSEWYTFQLEIMFFNETINKIYIVLYTSGKRVLVNISRILENVMSMSKL